MIRVFPLDNRISYSMIKNEKQRVRIKLYKREESWWKQMPTVRYVQSVPLLERNKIVNRRAVERGLWLIFYSFSSEKTKTHRYVLTTPYILNKTSCILFDFFWQIFFWFKEICLNKSLFSFFMCLLVLVFCLV